MITSACRTTRSDVDGDETSGLLPPGLCIEGPRRDSPRCLSGEESICTCDCEQWWAMGMIETLVSVRTRLEKDPDSEPVLFARRSTWVRRVGFGG